MRIASFVTVGLTAVPTLLAAFPGSGLGQAPLADALSEDRPESVVWLAAPKFEPPAGAGAASQLEFPVYLPNADQREDVSFWRVAGGGALGWGVAALIAGGGGYYLTRWDQLQGGAYGLLFVAPIGTAIGADWANDGRGSAVLSGLASFLGGAVGGVVLLAAPDLVVAPLIDVPATFLLTQVSTGVLVQRLTSR